jgi:catechol 2,3-dioxygenase-like lactoylglutathione lyase family enzyme
MSATPKLVHVVYKTVQRKRMSDWYCAVLDGHVVYENDNQTFITHDEEHHRIALLEQPGLRRRTAETAAVHHVAYTFDDLDSLLARYELLRSKGITPATSVAHGVTTSMYYEDPDGNFLELQIDLMSADDATAYMYGPDFERDPVGPPFDPEAMLRARRAGGSVAELTSQEWAARIELPDPMRVLAGGVG